MFHIYEGFHLVETYHKMRHQRKYHPEDSTKRAVKIAIVALVTLLLWNMPADVDPRNCIILGYFGGHHCADAPVLYG